MRKKIYAIFMICFMLVFSITAQGGAQTFDESQPLTQEEFAVEVVKLLKLEYLLPTAALAADCVTLLEQLGISPLAGWKPKALLTREDYLVIVGKVQGKEGLVHQRAVEVEQKNIEIINHKWQQAYEQSGEWIPLAALLNDKNYFPEGVPQSPYGLTYRDENNDHKADAFVSPIVKLIQLRENLSNQK